MSRFATLLFASSLLIACGDATDDGKGAEENELTDGKSDSFFRPTEHGALLENSLVTCGAGLGDGATHQYYDLPLIVAGKGQGQIKQGRFVRCKSGTLNSNMWLTLAQLMGLEIDAYADSTGVISDLWT